MPETNTLMRSYHKQERGEARSLWSPPGELLGGGKVMWVGGLAPWNSQSQALLLCITILVTVVKVKILSQGAVRTWLRPITH